ncbi:CKLF-like MARVEL transmembrane domain-containing protein 4 isoform X2 [Dreissena polymorpha]|uniref:MARVEL domain-containing protein n=1 Tax=Dreissena polymorpha TaxID=45954 RepID=A0A9D4IKW6_DREPO|nr:CKLF-like MARVEL transmembrane domain-containing protein 4 isoform X2 [Dreissena polymorpha]XP_052230888.1 CKLF-like MARVEL transmembrane domain-containing protein 4 isoform X2 [Dreissena polymorpha]KAH3776407.1 hypothetical protein DPMN_177830 [Dreissena polymorpha]
MMSASDIPGSGMATTVVTATAGDAVGSATGEGHEMKHIWKFIYIDMTYVKSLFGILLAAEMVLSLLGLICVSIPKDEGCAYLYSSAYSFYEFVASSCFILSLIWYILYLLAITRKLGFVRWDIAEIATNGFFILFFLIASSVIAAKACGQGGYNAAAVFGFFCMIVLAGHEFFCVRQFLERRQQASAQSTSADAADDSSKY